MKMKDTSLNNMLNMFLEQYSFFRIYLIYMYYQTGNKMIEKVLIWPNFLFKLVLYWSI